MAQLYFQAYYVMILPYKPAYLFSIKYFCKQILVLWDDKDIKREAQCLLITREIKSVSWIYPFLWLIRNKRRPIKKYIIKMIMQIWLNLRINQQKENRSPFYKVLAFLRQKGIR